MNQINRRYKLKIFIPKIAAVICCVLLLMTLILPNLTATKIFESDIDKSWEIDEFDNDIISKNQLKNISFISLLDFFDDAEEILGEETPDEIEDACEIYLIFNVVMIALILIFSLFALPGFTITVSVLFLAAFALVNSALVFSGVVRGDRYQFGIGFYLFIAAIIFVIATAIWMIIVKKRYKKEHN